MIIDEKLHSITIQITSGELEALVEDRSLWSTRDEYQHSRDNRYTPSYRSLVRTLVRRHIIRRG